MKHTVKPSSKKGIAATLLSLLLASLSFFGSFNVPELSHQLAFLGVALLCLSFFFCVFLVFVKYEYETEGNILTVKRLIGKRSDTVFDLDIRLSEGLYKRGDKRVKEPLSLCRKRLSFSAGTQRETKYILIYSIAGVYHAVQLSLSEEMANEIKSRTADREEL